MSEGVKRFFDESAQYAKRKSEDGDKWPIDFNKPYESTFRPLLEGSFQDLLERRRSQGKGTNVLDLFGSGFFVKHPNKVDSVTGVRLAERKAEAIEDAPNYSIISGDLFRRETWNQIDDKRKELGIDGYDLIVCAPHGGFGVGKNNPDVSREDLMLVYTSLLDRGLKLMSNDGVLFTQVPYSMGLSEEELAAFKEHMESKGVSCDIGTEVQHGLTHHVLKMSKSN